jgi:hypothetical protein
MHTCLDTIIYTCRHTYIYIRTYVRTVDIPNHFLDFRGSKMCKPDNISTLFVCMIAVPHELRIRGNEESHEELRCEVVGWVPLAQLWALADAIMSHRVPLKVWINFTSWAYADICQRNFICGIVARILSDFLHTSIWNSGLLSFLTLSIIRYSNEQDDPEIGSVSFLRSRMGDTYPVCSVRKS